ncbi:MAG: T9SS C-terminal target domain-containing protein [Chryseobacterium sp.]|nr:MAG: T9SS C-terminal target domain-containing protein [Chryseobacterium sp.]
MALYNPATEQWTFLGGLGQMFDNGMSSAWGLSSDGKTVVGLAWANGGAAHAIKWTATSGIVDLGSSVPGRSSRANAVNADGSVVVGWQDSNSGARYGVYWINGVQKTILDGQGNSVGEAMAVSANGKTIVGSSDPEGYIWNADTGYTKLEHSDPDYVGSVTALSDDGNVAIGYFRPSYDNNLAGEGFIWFKDRGLVKLDDYIEELGYDSLSFTFVLPTAISPDGKYIGGIGLNWDEEDVKGFVVKLPGSTMATTEVAKTAGLAVYPNPVADILNVATTGKPSTVEVFNASGQKVWSQNNDTKQIDLSHLAKGVYLLTATVDGKKQSTKFIKE